ncbi:MAG: ComF family protein [Clostridiales bacterium]|nr:ComF family protein [Clostridiales bacterium]
MYNFCMNISKLIFPIVRCSYCGKKTYDGNYLCEDCQRDLENLKRDNLIEGTLIKGHIIYEYNGIVKNLVIMYKYNQQRYLGKYFAKLMYDFIKKISIDFDVIIPVPSHWKRKLERGFNQTEIIAKELSKLMGIRYDNKILKRMGSSRALKNLNKEERESELENLFVASNKDFYKTTLLIDDIYTTGTTINYCGKALYEIGFDQVIFLSFSGNYSN